jgi:hypothetical protein
MFEGAAHRISQRRIVMEMLGAPVNVAASAPVILTALNGIWIDDDRRMFMVETGPRAPNFDEIIQDLANDYPLIIGTHGHAMVLVHLEYHLTRSGPLVIGAVVVDPAIGCERWLDANEWNGLMFVACVRITDLVTLNPFLNRPSSVRRKAC